MGSYTDVAKAHNGFLDVAGTFTKVNYPTGVPFTQPQGINNSGQIVGLYRDSADVAHGFLDVAGVFSSIDFPGASLTNVGGIDDSGVIVGLYLDAALTAHGFLDYVSGPYTRHLAER